MSKLAVGHHFNKHVTTNPIYRLFVQYYRKNLQEMVGDMEIYSVLEIGSGEGHIVEYVKNIKTELNFIASDIDFALVRESRLRVPIVDWVVCYGEQLPFPSESFDLVLACEVLEHLNHPELVMQEIKRVGRRWLLATVPHEPWWRLLNLMRLKYISNFGNTPGHLQHWTINGFYEFVSKFARVIHLRSVFPWIFLFAEID